MTKHKITTINTITNDFSPSLLVNDMAWTTKNFIVFNYWSDWLKKKMFLYAVQSERCADWIRKHCAPLFCVAFDFNLMDSSNWWVSWMWTESKKHINGWKGNEKWRFETWTMAIQTKRDWLAWMHPKWQTHWRYSCSFQLFIYAKMSDWFDWIKIIYEKNISTYDWVILLHLTSSGSGWFSIFFDVIIFSVMFCSFWCDCCCCCWCCFDFETLNGFCWIGSALISIVGPR